MSVVLLEDLLRHPTVTPVTRSVLNAILQRCVNQEYLASFVLRKASVRGAHEHYKAFVQFMEELGRRNTGGVGIVGGGYGARPGGGVGVGIHTSAYSPTFVPHMIPDRKHFDAQALNEEGRKWMCDFLLYVLFKRKGSLQKSRRNECWTQEYHSIEEEDMPGLADDWREKGNIYDEVEYRDGPFCALSGEAVDLVATRLLPQSQDKGRFDRFRELAAIFWCHQYDIHLTLYLNTAGNALLLTEEWMELLDEGRIAFYQMPSGKYYCHAFDEATARRLYRDRHLNGLEGIVAYLEFDYHEEDYKNNPLLWYFVQMHAEIVETWQATGLVETMVAQTKWLETVSNSTQNHEDLGHTGFASILQHRLAIF